jgi:hypothetical protein
VSHVLRCWGISISPVVFQSKFFTLLPLKSRAKGEAPGMEDVIMCSSGRGDRWLWDKIVMMISRLKPEKLGENWSSSNSSATKHLNSFGSEPEAPSYRPAPDCLSCESAFVKSTILFFSGPWPIIKFRNNFSHTLGILGHVISPSKGSYLTTEQHEHRINACTHQTAMPWVGFKPTIPASERAKKVHALDRAAIVTSQK